MALRALAARLRRLPLGAVVGGSGATMLAVQAQISSSQAREQPDDDPLDVDGSATPTRRAPPPSCCTPSPASTSTGRFGGCH